MKRLTDKKTKTIIMRSLPVAILAAIAFIMGPSVLPESYGSMRRSAATVECREYYEITSGGKVAAFCNDIDCDSTLNSVSAEKDSDTERKAMVCGCWMNRYSFFPSCNGRILTVYPFAKEHDMQAIADRNIKEIIAKTIAKNEKAAANNKKREEKLNYYLNTHNVKDEGYNTIAAYAEENKREKKHLQNSITILKSLQKEGNVKIRKKTIYTLVYAAARNKTDRRPCYTLYEETRKAPKGTTVIRTKDGFMPEGANAIYRFDVFDLSPEIGDSVSLAGIFGLTAESTADAALQKPNVFKGKAISADRHDAPALLAPEGAPIFNRHGYFIGINYNGGIAR